MTKFKKEIDDAVKLFADSGEEKCYQKLQAIIQNIKKIPENEHSPQLFYEWGLCLYIMEEYQQALLYFEKILRYDPSHELALLYIVSTLFYHLEKEDLAKQILDKKVKPQIKDLTAFKEVIDDLNIYLERKKKNLSSTSPKDMPPEDLSDLNLNSEK